MPADALLRDLARVAGDEAVRTPTSDDLVDATEARGLRGAADAVVAPGSPRTVAEVLGFCYARGIAVTPRGGGTGLAGGAVPAGGVVLSVERLTAIRELEPERRRANVEAGVTTATLRRRARESGLLFPPDPGAAEQSQVGGNIATNAGGPHALKYGSTGAWVTGVEAVVPPGELIAVGGPVRKDVAGYDLRGLLVGSEGTLGIVTAAWLRLAPAPTASYPVAAAFADVPSGCAAVERLLGIGLELAALEYLDAGALAIAGAAFPAYLPAEAAFLLLADVDGTEDAARALRAELRAELRSDALALHAPVDSRAIADVWRWRDGVSGAVRAHRGGKLSEDIAVPPERLCEAITETVAIGERHGLQACSFGHAGDGNLHSTFLLAPDDEDERERARAAAGELFDLAVRLGGTITGEHGIGLVKQGRLRDQWPPGAVRLHEQIKALFDPKGLLNPGKKLA